MRTCVISLALLLTACATPAESAQQPADLPTLAAEDNSVRYNRAAWKHWVTGPDGCDTRQMILKRDATPGTVRTGKGCRVIAGVWLSVYDQVTWTDPAQLEIDHVVALHEAHQSGGVRWSAETKQRFANDPDNLVAVTAAVNSDEKGDRDPAGWLPGHDQCGYLRRWVTIKNKYQLSADRAELDVYAARLPSCGG